MNYGLYLSATGVLTNMYRQDVITNNLANTNTVGFKPDQVYTRQRLPGRLETGAAIRPNLLLERLGGGHLLRPTYTNLRQGAVIATGNDLDVAIEGEGFLVVRAAADGGSGPVRLTRDGRLTLNANGELVMANTGLPILDVAQRPIRLDPTAKVVIHPDGSISQNGRVGATIQITTPRDPAALRKVGNSLFRLDSTDPAARGPGSGRLLQGHVESSAVNAITALKDLVGAAKSVQANAKMIQFHDHLMGQAVNTLGRVS